MMGGTVVGTSRTLIVVNKSWEADAAMAVLRSAKARPQSFPVAAPPPTVSVPLLSGGGKMVAARGAFTSPSGGAELWCIQDLMDPAVSSSSSQEKARVLPLALAAGPVPSLVIALGTAAHTGDYSYNGCVVAGCQVFVHNPYAKKPNSASNWVDPRFEQLVASPIPVGISWLDQDLRPAVEVHMLKPPLNPANVPTLIVSADFVALGSVNVTDYSQYVWVDPEAQEQLLAAGVRQAVGSVETTHGLIRLICGSPFMFLSGIANRSGAIAAEVAPRDYAQNFVAAHNAAMALTWLLGRLLA